MAKSTDGIVILLLSTLAVGLLSTLIRMSDGPAVLQAVVVLFTLSALGGVAFILGRSHARRRRDRRNPPPPPGP